MSYDDPFPGLTTLPELAAADLSAPLVGGAIAHHGGVVVRGMIDPERISVLNDCIDQTLDATRRFIDGAPVTETAPWYVPYGDVHPVFGEGIEWARVVDSPPSMYQVIEALAPVGAGVITDLLGERPAMAGNKWTLRRTTPDCLGGWHQDGQFLGRDTRVFAVWVALSPCGGTTPACGLEVLPMPVSVILPTGTEGLYTIVIDQSDVDRVANGCASQDPQFEPGDGVIFDQMTVHRTGHRPGLTEVRYGVESWFFASSTYPTETDAPTPMLF